MPSEMSPKGNVVGTKKHKPAWFEAMAAAESKRNVDEL